MSVTPPPNARYISYPIVTDPQDLLQLAFNYLQAKIPGWQPSEGQLDVWLLESAMGEAADIATLATEVPKTIFRYFGQKLFNIPPIDAVAATATVHIYLTDNAGHTVPAGTQVGIYDANNNLVPFVTVADAVVLAGQTNIDNVLIVAVSPGAASTGLGTVGGVVTLIDPISFIDHITQDTVSIGGQDAESDDDYLSRLSLELQTMSPRPILPNDFAILARNVAGVQRATSVDGYNPADGTFNNQRMVTVVSLDANGVPVSALIRTNVQNYLQALREINFVVNVMDAIVSSIDVTTHVALASGYAAADVQARITTAIQQFLSPAVWGIARTDDPNDPQTWNNLTVIRYTDLVAVVRTVAGVDHITDLTFGLHGGGLSTNDLNLTGVVPLPSPGTITAVAS